MTHLKTHTHTLKLKTIYIILKTLELSSKPLQIHFHIHYSHTITKNARTITQTLRTSSSGVHGLHGILETFEIRGGLHRRARQTVLREYAHEYIDHWTSDVLFQTRSQNDRERDQLSPKDDVVLMLDRSTAAINHMVHVLNLHVPLKSDAPQPVVFVGPFEHHSNELPWRESCAKVIRIPQDDTGHMCLKTLEKYLKEYEKTCKLMIGSFSACSNITGVLSPVNKIAALLHRHGALAFFDYATAGPYVDIDMNPVVIGDDAPLCTKMLCSCHLISTSVVQILRCSHCQKTL